MSTDDSQGQGEDQKNQGEDQGQDKNNDNDKKESTIELSKKDLSDKIIEGRNEGIEKGKKEAVSVLNETLGAEYSSLDELTEELSEAKLGDSEESEVVQELQDKLKAKDDKIQNLSQKVQDIRTERQLKESVNDQLDGNELSLPFDELRTLVESKYGYSEKDGTLYATKDGDRFLNDSGEYMTYAEAFKDYAKSRGLIKGGSSGGTGGSTNPNAGDKQDNPWVTGNATEQARIVREDRKKAERLKKQAGRK